LKGNILDLNFRAFPYMLNRFFVHLYWLFKRFDGNIAITVILYGSIWAIILPSNPPIGNISFLGLKAGCSG